MRKFHQDLPEGTMFGLWKVIRRVHIETRGRVNTRSRNIVQQTLYKYDCLCTGCNTTHRVDYQDLKRGKSTRCKRCAYKAPPQTEEVPARPTVISPFSMKQEVTYRVPPPSKPEDLDDNGFGPVGAPPPRLRRV